ncbi:hypothetical protein D3C86_1961050 [compost metagenome]
MRGRLETAEQQQRRHDDDRDHDHQVIMHFEPALGDEGADHAGGKETEAPEGMGAAHDAAANGVFDPVGLDIDDDLNATDGQPHRHEQEKKDHWRGRPAGQGIERGQ